MCVASARAIEAAARRPARTTAHAATNRDFNMTSSLSNRAAQPPLLGPDRTIELADLRANGVASIHGRPRLARAGCALEANPLVEEELRCGASHRGVVDRFDGVMQFVADRPHQVPVRCAGVE